MNRRDFCQHVVYVGFGSYFALAAGGCRDRAGDELAAAGRDGPGFLTPAQFRALAAACERLFPADQDPGAIALGAPGFVERQLATAAFSGWQGFFRTQLDALDTDARARHARPFAELGAAEQDAMLEAWSQGPRPRPLFVQRLLHLTLEGVFCDPVHGGNKGGAAWAMIGFAPGMPRPGGSHQM
jgi:gluconate 2-dehydrogenase gamma chain